MALSVPLFSGVQHYSLFPCRSAHCPSGTLSFSSPLSLRVALVAVAGHCCVVTPAPPSRTKYRAAPPRTSGRPPIIQCYLQTLKHTENNHAGRYHRQPMHATFQSFSASLVTSSPFLWQLLLFRPLHVMTPMAAPPQSPCYHNLTNPTAWRCASSPPPVPRPRWQYLTVPFVEK